MKGAVQQINNLTIGFQSQKGEQIYILKNISFEYFDLVFLNHSKIDFLVNNFTS